MKPGRASETARISALSRAAHRLLDRPPWILNDTWAGLFAGCRSDVEVRNALEILRVRLTSFSNPEVAASWLRASRLGVALRGRYCEDELVKAMDYGGVRQFVILGAGFDSFALRLRNSPSGLQVFEIDHPSTQDRKRLLLEELQAPVPANVTFVPIDFRERTGVFEALASTSFDSAKPAFFSFLGVSWYLSHDELDRALRELASCAASGSELVIDYLLPKHLLNEEYQKVAHLLSDVAASYGEEGGNCFEPAQITRHLRRLGFSQAQDFAPEEANARYCARRDDGLCIPNFLRIAKAVV